MATLNVSLPDDLKKIADDAVAKGRFASHSEYVRSLIRSDQKRREQEQLESLLLKRLQAGEAVPMHRSDFQKLATRLKTELARHKKARK